MEKHVHRSEAIKRHCMECMGFDGWRGITNCGTGRFEAATMVRECTDEKCQLYHFRNGSDERPGRIKKTLTRAQAEALQKGRSVPLETC